MYLGVEHDLGSPVPAGCHILCQEASVVMLGISYPCQPKVTDLMKVTESRVIKTLINGDNTTKNKIKLLVNQLRL